ncbi:MAG: RsmB/NOP family class I SAM-dependent RNA methyltransferase [Cyclobacteriaceae bacterium]|nr:RsmB/NOP family class I SAM-dependent RNA methyltransferase [Cyclobacteriaceae bacterium]
MKENFSWPSDFVNRMQTRKEFDTHAFLKSLQEDAPTSIRFNPSKTNAEEIQKLFEANLEKVQWTETGFYLVNRPNFTLVPALHGGHFYVQEASSMLLEQAVIQTQLQQPKLTILDACAAPGGKSTHLLSLLSKETLLISNEVIKSRASVLHENITKWGHKNVVITNSDPIVFGQTEGWLDAIIVDAPCSGEGLFRKDAHASEEWSVNNAQLCAQRQTRILEDLWPALKENGILIYSTCTFNPEENENNLKRFIKNNHAESIGLNINEGWGIEKVETNGITGYYCFPHLVKGEGFFLSVLRKISATSQPRMKSKKSVFTSLEKKHTYVKDWIKVDCELYQFKDQILALSINHLPAIDFLTQHAYLISCGLMMGEIKQNKVIPAHALALSFDLNENVFPFIDLEKEEALLFLRKDNFNHDAITQAGNGFNVMRYQNVNLGFINKISNRYNNLYPSEWRIRMELK